MANPGPAERAALVEQLSTWLRSMVGDEGNEIDFRLERGMLHTFDDDLEQPAVAPNGTFTLIVRVNGGARDSAGFRDPEADPV
jgi:hypothetical protein